MRSSPERGGGAKDFAFHLKWIVLLQQDSHCCPLRCASNVLNTFAQRGHFTPLAVVTSQTWLPGTFQLHASGLGQVSKDSSLGNCVCIFIRLQAENRSAVRGVKSLNKKQNMVKKE